MNIIKSSVHRPVTVIMLVICLLLVGAVTLRDIPIDLFPEIENKTVTVSASYNNVAPQDMEEMVTRPLEAQIASLSGVEEMVSTTSTGSVRIRVTFANSVEFDKAVSDLQMRMSRVGRTLPDGVDTPTVAQFDVNSIPVMTLALVGKDTISLQQIADDMMPSFERIEGVAGVSVQGGRSAELKVILNPILLKQYGLTASSVSTAIREKNAAGTVGAVPKGDEEIQIRVDGEYTSLDQIAHTPIRLKDGKTITVEDVADITNTSSEVDNITRINQEEGVLFSISKQSGSNTVDIADKVLATMENLQKEWGEDIRLVVVNDQSTFIRNAISGVTQAITIGGAIAVLILLFFLRSLRATLVIGVSIPLAVVTTFILIRYSDQTLNVITLSGLALGIGMMVDSSIVILENIIKHKQDGLSAKEAAIQGGSELVSAVIASTTTTLVVFLPLIMIDNGQISQLFVPMAVIVSFSLIAALVVAVTFVPMVASNMLTNTKNDRLATDPAWIRLLSRSYERLLRLSLKLRWLVVLTVVAITIGSCFFFSSFEVQTFPRSQEQRLDLSANFDEGTEFSKVEAYANQVEGILQKYKENIKLLQTSISETRVQVSLQLVKADEMTMPTAALSAAIQSDLKQNIVGANFTVGRQFRSAGGSGSALQVSIAGPDQEVLTTLLEQVELLLSRVPSLENVEVPSVSGRPQFTVRVDDTVASQYGLTQGDVMDQLSTVFDGLSAATMQQDGKEYNVVIQLPETESDTIEDLYGFLVQTSGGQHVSLETIASIEEGKGPVSIQRENQRQMYTVTADMVEGTSAAQVMGQVNQLLSQIPVPNGYEVTMGGMRQQFNESLGNLLLTIGLAIFLVYTVMAVQFESFTQPFIVMFTIPTAVVGVVVALLTTGLPLSFPVFIGMIVLAGIVVNNAIILIEYINQLRERGMDKVEAIVEAGGRRLRPILMTTVTTVLGMLPLSLGLAEGSETQQPIGVVTIFGLSISMLFTLFFIPIMYTLVDDAVSWLKRLFTKGNEVIKETGGNGKPMES
ncbi:efflux RND transporter permease subunit [Ammoniphilus sp. CFH 90114]|uniref:efflux RND transporter permease subunit n=1 Tax=Ammoniphilus sp. CFH 90114 TaxID=2493665 RepID=UPI00100F752C|nr:efflux RND transporter permease subunit [Ammoniphilus sp. CFH 90114]RXT15426.1 efflux RND transporter permease subunit [Ammoniphilus sp. CFH 90114]